jgi:predicted nucleic acid-binding Zn ribbon protein
MSHPIPEQLEPLAKRTAKLRRRFHANEPKKLADVVARIIAKRGLGKDKSNEQLKAAWRAAAGPAIGQQSQAVAVRRGKLEVLVASSLLMQEIGFHRPRILAELQQKFPEAKITDLKLRVGQIQ